MIIHATDDIYHAIFGTSLYKFNLILHKLALPFQSNLRQYTLYVKRFCEVTMATQSNLKSKSHMPKNSVFFEKIVPISLITMGVITVGLILFAAGVILGIVQF